MRYYQCRLRRRNTEVIGWIEERGARPGRFVELLEFGRELFRVEDVYPFGVDADALRNKQRLDRNSLASIRNA